MPSGSQHRLDLLRGELGHRDAPGCEIERHHQRGELEDLGELRLAKGRHGHVQVRLDGGERREHVGAHEERLAIEGR